MDIRFPSKRQSAIVTFVGKPPTSLYQALITIAAPEVLTWLSINFVSVIVRWLSPLSVFRLVLMYEMAPADTALLLLNTQSIILYELFFSSVPSPE